MKILFIGDIVGELGRSIVLEKTEFFVKKYGIDFVIANGENATHGKGLIQRHYEELIDGGIDLITLGNHYESKNEIVRYIENADRLIRPINIVKEFPGDGTAVFDINGTEVRVTNVLGSAFINEDVRSPYHTLLSVIENNKAPIHIVDLHAEATGEKLSIAHALDGKVSAVLGTHTHVQTNDAKILQEGTAYISDVGMCGLKDGILGFDANSVIARTIYNQQSRFETPKIGKRMFNAVILDVDEYSGKTKQIFTINYQE